MLLNAEGTRFTESKHKASVEFAKERGMPVLKHHLIPRTKGFTTSIPYIRDKCKYIVDVQLAFDKDAKVAPTITNLLFGQEIEAHLYIRLVKVDEIPHNEEGAAEWLHELFRRKDRMQDSFHQHGDFFKSSNVPSIPRSLVHRRIQPFLNVVFWTVVTMTPILYYLAKLLFSGELFFIALVAAILAICEYFTFHREISQLIYLFPQFTPSWSVLLTRPKSNWGPSMAPRPQTKHRDRVRIKPIEYSSQILIEQITNLNISRREVIIVRLESLRTVPVV